MCRKLTAAVPLGRADAKKEPAVAGALRAPLISQQEVRCVIARKKTTRGPGMTESQTAGEGALCLTDCDRDGVSSPADAADSNELE